MHPYSFNEPLMMGSLATGIGGLIIFLVAIRVIAVAFAIKNHQYGWAIVLVLAMNIPLIDLVYIFAFQQKRTLTTAQWWDEKTTQIKALFSNTNPPTSDK